MLGAGGRGVENVNSPVGKNTKPEPKQAQALYSMLFSPLEQAGLFHEDKYKHLVIVASGPLLDMPFAALMDSKGKRLVERFPLSLAVSFSMLTWPIEKQPSSGTLLCVADPFGSKGQQLASLRGDDLLALKHARAEGEALYRLFAPSSASLLLTGDKATESVVKQKMKDYAILHFATHGRVVESAGLLSELFLAPGVGSSFSYGTLLA